MGRSNKRTVYAGVDVSSDVLHVCLEGLDGQQHAFESANNQQGFTELLERVTAGPRVKTTRMVLEATGPYSAGLLAAAMDNAKVQVMRVEPRKAKLFIAVGARGKTDRVDARALCAFAKTSFFKPTVLPSKDARKVRKMSRHLAGMVKRKTALKNQRHAAKVEGTLEHIEAFISAELESLETCITSMQKQILQVLATPELTPVVEHWKVIKGVGDGVVAGVLPELLALPKGLTPKQVTAMMGLDPRPNQSGKKGTRGSFAISKRGIGRVRQLLWLSASSAVQHEPAIKAYYDALLARGKAKGVACVAVMRKLLVSLWCMYRDNSPFRPEQFTSRFQVANGSET